MGVTGRSTAQCLLSTGGVIILNTCSGRAKRNVDAVEMISPADRDLLSDTRHSTASVGRSGA